MAEKKFGVRDLEIIDPTGTPTIESSGDLIVNAGGATERLRVTSSGSIGIGTDNPISLLSLQQSGGGFEVNASSGSNNARLLSYDRVASAYREMTFQAASYGFEVSGSEKLRILSGGGLTFNGDTAAANALDDYEEGTLNWRLQRDDNIGAGNNVNTRVTYTKIGNRVYISGYIYTQNTGSSTSGVYIVLRDNSNISNAATLPYLPNHSGGFPVTGTRTISDNYRNMAVTFQENSTTVYLYRDDGDNNYVKNVNNVAVSKSQTHLVLQFCGSYTTNS